MPFILVWMPNKVPMKPIKPELMPVEPKTYQLDMPRGFTEDGAYEFKIATVSCAASCGTW